MYLSLGFQSMQAHYAKALDLAGHRADEPVADLRWAERLYHLLAWTRGMTVSWLAPEVGHTWRKALDLAEQTGDRFFIAPTR